jgi:hypothetical protein
LKTLTSREAQAGQNGRGGKYTLAQASQRCRRSSPARVPSQKCWVSGVGFGFARAGSAMVSDPPSAVSPQSAGSGLDATLDAPASTVHRELMHGAYSGTRTIV